MFRTDGRVQHAECPAVVCPACSKEIPPGTPIRRDGDAMLHANCWMRLFRARERSRHAPEISGGCAAGAWTLIFDIGLARQASRNPADHRALRAAVAETIATAVDTRGRGRAARARVAALLAASAARRATTTTQLAD